MKHTTRQLNQRVSLITQVVTLVASFAICVGVSSADELAGDSGRSRLKTGIESGPPDSFIRQYCVDCHDSETSNAGLNLQAISIELDDQENFRRWERIYDRVLTGEMPPKDEPRPNARQQETFLAAMKDSLIAADQRARAEHGRVQGRRLTRREYEHTIHDLIGVDMPLDEILPEDPLSHGFDTVAIGQQLSQHHLIRYIQAADVILAEAFERTLGNESRFTASFTARQLSGRYHSPELRGNKIIAWPIARQYYSRMPNGTAVPEPGWYRYTLKDVHAINPNNGVLWGTVRSFRGDKPQVYPVGIVEATTEPRDMTFEGWIRDRHVLEIRPNDTTEELAPLRTGRGTPNYEGKDYEKDGFGGLAWSGFDVERIYPYATREELHSNLFGDLTLAEIRQPGSRERQREVLEKLVHEFASRAFRHPVTTEQVERYVELGMGSVVTGGSNTGGIANAIRAAYRGILCSPRFLTFIESPGKLNDHAIAARLSYALWNSLPDPQLRAIADSKKLSDPAVFHEQVDRLLDDSKADRFVAGFTDQWLNLKDINFTTPAASRFRTFGVVVQESMVAETRAFVRELIAENLSIENVIQSDFTFLNERLARFYRYRDPSIKPGSGMQKVRLTDSRRGGLITHGSVLKVTADGSTTSPVIRGVWLSERILGIPIPPPPANIPAVEPDIRGAISIRDQLAKHRNIESCAVCHRKLDPAGFALESFDPVGAWRQKYSGAPNAALVDPSGVTPDGEMFADIREWKSIYRTKTDLLANAFARQLLTYSTGAPPCFSDRDAIEAAVAEAANDNYGLRSIVHAALASDVFLTN